MKKKCFTFVLVLLLALSFCTPVMAAQEYGSIYDETEMLGSQTLKMQGEQMLPQLSQTLGFDLRVDVLTVIGDDDSIIDTAAWIYEAYGYGSGDAMEGATLTILMEPQEAGSYAMPDTDGWCVYVSLSAQRGSSQALSDAIRDAVQPYMDEQVWNGEDINMSAVALTQAVDAMASAAEEYILTNCSPVSSGADGGAQTPEASGPAVESGIGEDEAPEQNSAGMQYVFDISNLLSYEEWAELESRAAAISQRHRCGVYFALIDNYRDYGDGSVYEVTYQLYHNSRLGMGDGRDGIIVLLSMDERDYAIFVYGKRAEYTFDEYGQEQLEGVFLEDFGRNDWNGGISHYLDACDEYLTKAGEGKPVRRANWPRILMAAGLSCVVAGATCFLLMRSMKTVHRKAEANEYIAAGGLQLTNQYNRYTHTTQTRTKIEKAGSGSGTSESGGGGSGRSGKF